MISDTDMLAGIREAGRAFPAWATVELDSPCPEGDMAAALQVHFGVGFSPEELGNVTSVRALVDLLRRKMGED